jgi:hypothetical protein
VYISQKDEFGEATNSRQIGYIPVPVRDLALQGRRESNPQPPVLERAENPPTTPETPSKSKIARDSSSFDPLCADPMMGNMMGKIVKLRWPGRNPRCPPQLLIRPYRRPRTWLSCDGSLAMFSQPGSTRTVAALDTVGGAGADRHSGPPVS